MSVAGHPVTYDLSIKHAQSCKQGSRSIALVIVCLSSAESFLQGQSVFYRGPEFGSFRQFDGCEIVAI